MGQKRKAVQMTGLKYIELDGGNLVLFSANLRHKDIAAAIGQKVVSAGAIKSFDGRNLQSYGGSESMHIEADESVGKSLQRVLELDENEG